MSKKTSADAPPVTTSTTAPAQTTGADVTAHQSEADATAALEAARVEGERLKAENARLQNLLNETMKSYTDARAELEDANIELEKLRPIAMDARRTIVTQQHSEFPRNRSGHIIGKWFASFIPDDCTDKRMHGELEGPLVDRALSLGCVVDAIEP